VIEKTFGGLARGSIRRPGLTLAIAGLLMLAAAPGLLHLRLRTDGHALVPHDDPAVRADAAIREHFDLRDPIVILIHSEHPDGIYNVETLAGVRRLSEALTALAEIGPDHVMSLATERRDRVYPGTLKFRPFLEPLPDTPELLARLRSDVRAARTLLEGTLVAADASSTAILVGVPGSVETGDRVALYRRIRETAEAHRAANDRIDVVGAPVAEALLGIHLLEDLSLLLPASIALIAVVIWVGCRRLWGVVLALTEVLACLVWTFGIMGFSGVPVYLTIAVLPVILTTLGLADEIHVFWHYQRVLAERPDTTHPAAVVETMRRMVRPVVLTSLTTSVGFLSFLASPIEPVRMFGLFAAVGILFCMLWTLTVIPALLTRIDPRRMGRPAGRTRPGRFVRAVTASIRRRRLTLSAVLVLSVLAAAGLGRLYVQDSWIGGFARESPFRRAVDQANTDYHGTHLLLAQLSFDTETEPAALFDPAVVEAIGELETFLRDRPGVGGALGAHSHLTTMHFLSQARRVEPGSLPADPAAMKQLMIFFDKVRGAQRRGQIIDDDALRTVVTIFLKHANYRDTARLMDEIRDHVETRLAPLGARLEFAGDVAVSQAMIPAIVRTQVRSVLLALGIALVVLIVLLRSVRAALCAAAPAMIAALWVFGAMGWLGLPLGVATSMFCAITLGIGVDYGIHLVEGVRRARAAGRAEPAAHAVGAVGPAIGIDTLAIGLGFGLLTASSVPANARLGLLVALALAASCLLTLAGLGALLSPRRPGV